MSFLDPLEDLKQKKTNIFDFGWFQPQSTSVPTKTPVNQYTTPAQTNTPSQMTGTKQLDMSWIGGGNYSPVPNYTAPTFTPTQTNIFQSPSYQNELQTRLKNPMDNLSIGVYNQRVKAMVGGIDDLVLWQAPEQDFMNAYPDLSNTDKQSLMWLSYDLQRTKAEWGDLNKLLETYKDLPKYITDYVKTKYIEPPKEYFFKPPTLITKENQWEYSALKMLTASQKVDPNLYIADWYDPHVAKGMAMVANLWGMPASLAKWFWNLVLSPQKTIPDMINMIWDMVKGTANNIIDKWLIVGMKDNIDELTRAVAINPELIFWQQIIEWGWQLLQKWINKVWPVINRVDQWANRLQKNTPEWSTIYDTAQTYLFARIRDNLKKSWQALTPENISIEANRLYKEITGWEPVTKWVTQPTAEPTTVDSTQPYNQWVDASWNPAVRPTAVRTKATDSMVDQSIANTIKGAKNYNITEKFKNSAVEGIATLLDNREATPYLFDENLKPSTETTTHVNTSQAIYETKNDLRQTQIAPLVESATQAGATIDTIPIINAISDSIKWMTISDGTIIPWTETAYNTMLKMLNMFMDEAGQPKQISLSDAQTISQALNKISKPMYQWASAGDFISMMAVDWLNQILRPAIDAGVEMALDTAGLTELKRRRGALSTIETPITKRWQVIGRQPKAGLFWWLSDLYSWSELAGATMDFATGNIWSWIKWILRAGATKLISRYLKNLNDRNRMLSELMTAIDKQRGGFYIPWGYRAIKVKQAPRKPSYEGTPQLPVAPTPTPVWPSWPQVNVPNTPQPTVRQVIETVKPMIKDEVKAEVKAELERQGIIDTTKADLGKTKESIGTTTETKNSMAKLKKEAEQVPAKIEKNTEVVSKIEAPIESIFDQTEKSIQQQVKEWLDVKQAKRQFKDVNERVAGSRKEKSLYKKFTTDDLKQAEAQWSAFANDIVTKGRLVDKYDPIKARAEWEDAGVAYMKNKLYGLMSNKPWNSPIERQIYTYFAPLIMDAIKQAKTLDEINNVWYAYFQPHGSWSSNKVRYEMRNLDAEIDGMETPRDMSTVFGKSFLNLLYKKSESALAQRGVARRMNQFTKEMQTANYNRILEQAEKNGAVWASSLETFVQQYPQYAVKEWDRSWMDKWPQTKEVSWIPQIHSYEKLDTITREWWRLVTDSEILNPKTLEDNFWYKSVQFWNYVNDVEAKTHIKHFIESMKDLEDITGLDIKKMNSQFGLSMSFGARWAGKALAHYEPSYRIINITKSRWDWSVAHERWHFFDNFAGETLWKKWLLSKNIWDYGVWDTEIGNALRWVMQAIVQWKSTTRQRITPKKASRYYPWLRDAYKKWGVEEATKRVTDRIERGADNGRELYQYLANEIWWTEPIQFDIPSKYTKYYSDSKLLGEYRQKPQELFARAWEAYIQDTMTSKGIKNNYLVGKENLSRLEIPRWKNQWLYDRYPMDLERVKINKAFYVLIEAMKNTLSPKQPQ